MKGMNHEGTGAIVGGEETLPGLGPKIGIERLQRREDDAREIRLSGDERAALDLMQAQIERYEWFAQRARPTRSIEELAGVLFRPPEGPGLWEEALVSLSLREDVMAHALLVKWESPAGDAGLELFHQICLSRSRRRVGA